MLSGAMHQQFARYTYSYFVRKLKRPSKRNNALSPHILAPKRKGGVDFEVDSFKAEQ